MTIGVDKAVPGSMQNIYLDELREVRAALVDQRRALVRACISRIKPDPGATIASASNILATQEIIDGLDRAIDDERALGGPQQRYRIGA